MRCIKCSKIGKYHITDIRSDFVLNSKLDICNDCWIKLTEQEMTELRIKDWRIKK